MPVTVRIIENANLVYVKHGPVASAGAALEEFDKYLAHEEFVPLQHHLVDLSDVQSFERDYPAMLALMARLIESAPPARAAPILGVYAPTQAGLEFTRFTAGLRSSRQLIVVIEQTESRLLEAMGLRARSIAELLGQHACDT